MGWFSPDTNCYNIYFRDGENTLSYKTHEDQQFEYLDHTRYNSPMAVVNMLSEFAHSAMSKPPAEDTPGYDSQVCVLVMRTSKAILRLFNMQFSGRFHIKETELGTGIYSLVFTTKLTMQELLSYVYLFCMFNVLRSRLYLYIGNESLDKLLRLIHLLDAPYFIRHEFKVAFLHRADAFKKYKTELERSTKQVIQLAYGDTGHTRSAFLEKNILPQMHILDIGCGEGAYMPKLSKIIAPAGKNYFGVDTDPEVLAEATERAQRKQVANAAFLPSVDEFEHIHFGPENPVQVIMSEVIEHMAVDDARSLVNRVAAWPVTERIVLTTPNKTFNPLFCLEDEETRHEDHHFELTRPELNAFIQTIRLKPGWAANVIPVGDVVDGEPLSFGVVLAPGTPAQETHNA